MSDLHTSPSIATLDRDWDSHYASVELTITDAPATTGGTYLELLRGDGGDPLFRTLIRAAQRGEREAMQVLIRTMRPSILTIATYFGKRNPHITRDEATDLALSAMYDAIATYRVEQWKSSAAVNLSYQARKIMARDLNHSSDGNEEIPTDPTEDSTLAALEALDSTTYLDSIVFVLSWAIDHDVLTRDEVSLMTRWELGTPAERSALSVELEASQQTLRQRSFRLRRRIRDAVVDHLS